MDRQVDTLVVGAGISGLVYAHALLTAGADEPGAAKLGGGASAGRAPSGGAPVPAGSPPDLLVLEAAPRAGGLITTHATDTLHVECGPEALLDNAPATRALLERLGLEVLAAGQAAQRRFVLDARGRLLTVPTGPGAFLRSPLLSPLGKLRLLTEPWRAADVALDGSVADFVRHRLGRQVLERLVDPALSGIYAGDPELLSLRATFPPAYELVAQHGSLVRGLFAKLKAKKRARAEAQRAAAAGQDGRTVADSSAASPPAPAPPLPAPPSPTPRRRPPTLLSVRGGLQRLPEALAAALGPRLQLGAAVQAVRRDGSGWLALGPGLSVRARRLVLAVPVAPLARLLAESEPGLHQQAASMPSETVLSIAHAWPRAAVAHALDGFGYLVPSSLQKQHLGTLFSSSIQPARCPPDTVLLRTLLGGARHPELAERDDAELLALVRTEVGAVLGCRGAPTFSHVTRWRAALPRYDLQQVSRQDRIDELLAARPGLAILGNHRRGISVNALIESATRLAASHRAEDAAGPGPRGFGEHAADTAGSARRA